MIRNFFKTAIRNLIRKKGYATINIAGLAVGIAACLLLFLIVKYELSYDKFQPEYRNISRVVTQDKFSDGITYNAGIPVPAVDALRLKMPNTVFGSMLSASGSQVTIDGGNESAASNKKFIEENSLFSLESHHQ